MRLPTLSQTTQEGVNGRSSECTTSKHCARLCRRLTPEREREMEQIVCSCERSHIVMVAQQGCAEVLTFMKLVF